ncbi:hypothetical protein [Phascolarctobacterium succinatutens]|uniref:hypothetical protein n=1 Tax=Phascolarctobacterium succinatutens TaxID=626940 RepID=UPI0026EED0D0|nr:hypothetical protein [Phascolarctobacterium succinatutens]
MTPERKKWWDSLPTNEFECEDSELMKAAGMIKAYCSIHCCVVCPFFDEGEEEIVKMPWKPKFKETYWTFDGLRYTVQNETRIIWEVTSEEWWGAPLESALLDKGWVYRTCAEAEAALPAVAKEMGVEYEL